MKQDNTRTLTGQRLEVPEPPEERVLRWQQFPASSLPDPLRAFVAATARAIGCDPSMIALPALAGCAAMIGTTRQVRLKRSWAEPCILWCAVVARSGSIKSPALDHALAPARRLQSVEFKSYSEQLEANKRAKLEYEAALSEWRRRKRDRGDPPVEPTEPTAIRYLVSDCTVQALAPILAQNPRGLLLARDELSGWLGSFNEYKGGKGSDVANWLEMHRAGPVVVDRKTGVRIIAVPRAAVSVCGTIQPKTLLRQLTPEFFDCGLAARLLLAMPPDCRKRWTEAEIPESTRQQFADAIGRLVALQQDVDSDGEPIPRDLTLAPEAKGLWIDWYNECAERLTETSDDRLAASLAKIEGGAARLALVCQLVRDPMSDIIDADAMLAGIILARWFAREAERVYAVWDESPTARARRELVELIARKGGRVTARQLQQTKREFRDHVESAETALDDLARSGLGQWVHEQPNARDGTKRGRPRHVFQLTRTDNANENTSGVPENANSVDVDVVDAGGTDVAACTDREVIEL